MMQRMVRWWIGDCADPLWYLSAPRESFVDLFDPSRVGTQAVFPGASPRVTDIQSRRDCDDRPGPIIRHRTH